MRTPSTYVGGVLVVAAVCVGLSLLFCPLADDSPWYKLSNVADYASVLAVVWIVGTLWWYLVDYLPSRRKLKRILGGIGVGDGQCLVAISLADSQVASQDGKEKKPPLSVAAVREAKAAGYVFAALSEVGCDLRRVRVCSCDKVSGAAEDMRGVITLGWGVSNSVTKRVFERGGAGYLSMLQCEWLKGVPDGSGAVLVRRNGLDYGLVLCLSDGNACTATTLVIAGLGQAGTLGAAKCLFDWRVHFQQWDPRPPYAAIVEANVDEQGELQGQKLIKCFSVETPERILLTRGARVSRAVHRAWSSLRHRGR